MSKIGEAVAIAQQISELKRKLKLLEKGMSLKEFIAYVEGHSRNSLRPIPKCRYIRKR